MVWYKPGTWFSKPTPAPAPAPKPAPAPSSGGGYEVIRGGQGFSTKTPSQGDIIIKEVPSSSSGSSSKVGSGGGTYNPSTGVYIDPSGQGFSTNTPPTSAIVQSTNTGYNPATGVQEGTKSNVQSLVNPNTATANQLSGKNMDVNLMNKPKVYDTPTLSSAQDIRDTKIYSQGFGSSFGQSLSLLGGAFTGKNKFSDVFAPNKYYGNVKADTIMGLRQDIGGTAITNPMGEMQGPYVTYREYENKIIEPYNIQQTGQAIKIRSDIENIGKDVQGKINAGADFDTSVSEYNKRTADAIKAYETGYSATETAKINAISNAGLSDIYTTRPAQENLKNVYQVGKAGAYTGAFILAPELGVGLLTAEGVYKTTKSASLNEGFTEALFEGRASASDTQFYSPLTAEYNQLRTEGGMALLGAGAGAVALSFNAGNAVTQARIEEGLKSRSLTNVYKVGQVGDDSVFLTKSLKRTPNFAQDTRTIFTTTPKTDNTFAIQVSKGQSKIQFVDFMKQVQGYGDDAIVTLDKNFVFAGRGFQTDKALLWKQPEEGVLNVPKVFKQGTSGEGYFTMDGTTKTFNFQSAITKETKSSMFGLGGKVTKGRLVDTPKIVDAYNKPFIRSYISSVDDAFRIKDVTKLSTSSGVSRNLLGTSSQDNGVINLASGQNQMQITQQINLNQGSTAGGFATSLERGVSQEVVLQQSQNSLPIVSPLLKSSVLLGEEQKTATITIPKTDIIKLDKKSTISTSINLPAKTNRIDSRNEVIPAVTSTQIAPQITESLTKPLVQSPKVLAPNIIPTPRLTPEGMLPIGSWLPKLPELQGGRMTNKVFKGKRDYTYVPDFKSQFFGITGAKPSKLGGGLGYGEQARPIIAKSVPRITRTSKVVRKPSKVKSFLKGIDNRITLNLKSKGTNYIKRWRMPKI